MPSLLSVLAPYTSPSAQFTPSSVGLERSRRRLQSVVILLLLPLLFLVDANQTESRQLKGGAEHTELSRRRSLRAQHASLWPGGEIIYDLVFDKNYIFTIEEKDEYVENISEAMKWWERDTCVRFVTCHPNCTENYTKITIRKKNTGCTTYVGFKAPAFLDKQCLTDIGKIAHELGHMVGFSHEQSRYDRDRYIKVNWTNIVKGRELKYTITENINSSFLNTQYDLNSIMHYPPFSGDCRDLDVPIFTLRENVFFDGEIGQRECLSYFDIDATNRMYGCSNTSLPNKTECNFHPTSLNTSAINSSVEPLPTSPTSNKPTAMQVSPTNTPTTSSPEFPPTSDEPTSMPVSPTNTPTTSSLEPPPSSDEPTAMPTNTPTTSSLEPLPTSDEPTAMPTSPTNTPTTSSPEPPPTSDEPTAMPTSPTNTPTTSSLEPPPTSDEPTAMPTSPTNTPTMSSPEPLPTLNEATAMPTSPTSIPTTSSLEPPPTSDEATAMPTSPTSIPTTSSPEPPPTSDEPTAMQVSPTNTPTTSSPEPPPTSDELTAMQVSPTNTPTTSSPEPPPTSDELTAMQVSPTNTPTTSSPEPPPTSDELTAMQVSPTNTSTTSSPEPPPTSDELTAVPASNNPTTSSLEPLPTSTAMQVSPTNTPTTSSLELPPTSDEPTAMPASPTNTPTSTEVPTSNPKYIYPGDVLGFKSTYSSAYRWIGCTEDDKCFSWPCPGAKFIHSERRCHQYKFTISPVDRPSGGIRSGDRIILQQHDPDLGNSAYVPLQCMELRQQCLLSTDDSCQSHSLRHSNRSECSHHIFRIEALEREHGRLLVRKDEVMLLDDSNTEASLACNVRRLRRRKRTCQLEICSEECSDIRHHFIVYKL